MAHSKLWFEKVQGTSLSLSYVNSFIHKNATHENNFATFGLSNAFILKYHTCGKGHVDENIIPGNFLHIGMCCRKLKTILSQSKQFYKIDIHLQLTWKHKPFLQRIDIVMSKNTKDSIKSDKICCIILLHYPSFKIKIKFFIR